MIKKIDLFVYIGLELFILAGCVKADLLEPETTQTTIPTQTLFSPTNVPFSDDIIATITPTNPTETSVPPTLTPTIIPTLYPVGDFTDRGQRVGWGWEISQDGSGRLMKLTAASGERKWPKS